MARYWEEMNYPQPTEEELQENARNTRKKAAAKGQTLHPIVIKSRQIANSWWGQQLVGQGMVSEPRTLC